MTGVKTIQDCFKALNILCTELQSIKGILYKNKIVPIFFATNAHNLSIEKVRNFKICMINSGFNIGFNINRSALYNVISKDTTVKCKYNLDNHACVDIKYFYKDRKKISIFVFEGGSIIITGGNNCNHIYEAFTYISSQLYENYKTIKNIQPKPKINDIRQFLKTD
jgi:TATA-box binding protein (TBP) (component of TFIID and TFIIIB)